MAVRRPPSVSPSIQAPALTAVVAGALVVVLALAGLVTSSVLPVVFAAIAMVIAGAAAIVLLVRASRPLSRGATAAVLAAVSVSIIALVGLVVAALGVLVFLMSYGDPAPIETAVPATTSQCDAISREQNEAAVDGMTLDDVESVLGRQLVLRDHQDATDGPVIDVYEWQQFASENGCDQYASYEFHDSRLVFRRWMPVR